LTATKLLSRSSPSAGCRPSTGARSSCQRTTPREPLPRPRRGCEMWNWSRRSGQCSGIGGEWRFCGGYKIWRLLERKDIIVAHCTLELFMRQQGLPGRAVANSCSRHVQMRLPPARQIWSNGVSPPPSRTLMHRRSDLHFTPVTDSLHRIRHGRMLPTQHA
jgi:hypothetical protein